MNDNLLSPQEAAARIGASLTIVYRAIRAGELAAQSVNRRTKIDPAVLDAWSITRRCVGRPRVERCGTCGHAISRAAADRLAAAKPGQ